MANAFKGGIMENSAGIKTKLDVLKFTVSQPKKVLVAWLAFMFVMASFIIIFPGLQLDPGFKNMIMSNDPDRALNIRAKSMFGDDEIIVIALENKSGIFNLHSLEKINRISSAALNIVGVKDVRSVTDIDNIRDENGALNIDDLIVDMPTTNTEVGIIKQFASRNHTYINNIISEDHTVAGINIELDPAYDDENARGLIVEQVINIVDLERATGPEVIYITGFPVASYFGGKYMLEDMLLFAVVCGFIIIGLMWYIYRNIVGIVATMFVSMLGVMGVYGMMALFSIKVSMPLSSMMIFVMALGMEYSLYVAYAYVEKVYAHKDPNQALVNHKRTLSNALWEVRKPVFVSVLTTAIAFLSMWTNPVPELSKMGLLLAFGAALVGLAAITVIPAFISQFHFTLDPVKKPNPLVSNFMGRVAKSTTVSPKKHLLLMIVIMGLAVTGWSKLSHDTNAMEYFKEDASVRVGDEFVTEHLGGTTFLQALIETPENDTFKKPDNLHKLEQIQRFSETLPHVTKTFSHADNIKLINRAMNEDDPVYFSIPENQDLISQYLLLTDVEDFHWVVDEDHRNASILLRIDTKSAATLEEIERRVEVQLAVLFPQYKTNVVGTNLLVHRAFDEMATSMLVSLGQALVAIWIVLIFVFKSLRLASLAIISNAIPVALIYAILGWLGKPLDPPAAVTGAIALGIAIDDTVHFYSTWQRNMALNGQNSKQAVTDTLKQIGRPMVLSTLVMGFGFAVMLLSQYGTLVWMAVMLCAAAMSALVADLIVTPAILSLAPGKKSKVQQTVVAS